MKKMTIGMVAAAVAAGTAVADVAKPTMGWSSWNTYRVNISEELIKRQAKALVDGGYTAVGYTYVNIDDGWFGGRDKDGRHTTNPKRFPNGLKPVADYIHSLGLKAGIYSDAGENTCGSIWDNDVLGIGVGFSGHDAEDADWYFDEMGFDFIKIDFGGGIPKGNKAGVYMDERERYTAIAQEIARVQKKVGREIRMNVCCWRFPGEWVADIAGSWRIGPDLGTLFESVKGQIDKCSYLARFQKPGHYNDMDMLQVGRGKMTAEEDRTHFGMWCMMCSPLLIGCDLTTITPETAALLKNTDLIALNQDPLGKQAEVFSRDWKEDWRVYVKPLAPAGSMNRAIALYNGTESNQTVTAELDAMGYGWDEVTVWDCYEHKALPNARRKIVAEVPPHGTRIYRLAPVRGASIPCGKLEQDSYDWYARHGKILAHARQLDPEIVFLGDSITHFWAGRETIGGEDADARWKASFGRWRTLNAGFGWDRTCNVLWRIDRGELDGLSPKAVVVHIGGNNFSKTANYPGDTAEAIAEANFRIVERVHEKLPGAKVVLMAVTPFGVTPDDWHRPKQPKLNALLREGAKRYDYVTFVDANGVLLDEAGRYCDEYRKDGVHPSTAGYERIASVLVPVLERLTK